ncbi:hypothetical protein F5Y19DRAFT_470318 [Xylariaceae sp. FL1651]|nr:hypothetical protein F5Y19DRAFT_470318 [Xylariaceae sp. FL1651]
MPRYTNQVLAVTETLVRADLQRLTEAQKDDLLVRAAVRDRATAGDIHQTAMDPQSGAGTAAGENEGHHQHRINQRYLAHSRAIIADFYLLTAPTDEETDMAIWVQRWLWGEPKLRKLYT